MIGDSYLKDNKYMHITTFRNYTNPTVVNKESLESKGYAIDVKNTPGWFFNNIAELTISKNDPVSNDATKEEEYTLLKKAMCESEFHVTHVEDGEVVIEYLDHTPKKLE
jgi:hypothetical protein